ncbi:HAD family hydrolase [Streptomyces sp. NBC_00647]|uniref:HAD family hydrolase n=1 Tax=Streptomyces sp. NBC_00647 TaxID=2975796 RepID=UPI0032441CB3
MNVDLDDIRDVRELLADVRCVLFDFDGPICRLFPQGSSMRVADELRARVDGEDLVDVLTQRERADKDPHVVLRAMHRARGQRDLGHLVAELEALVTAGEVEAARRAWRTPGADSLVRLLAERGYRLAVVTNNSPRAVDSYLQSHGLAKYFASVHGRTASPELMKPHPDVVIRALRSLNTAAADAVMIGDTPSDVEAAHRAGVRFIGYGRNSEKRARLREAGAKPVFTSYVPLLDRM